MSNARGSQVGQARPANTTAAAAFTATLPTEVTCIVVCNTSGADATCRLFHDDDGSTYDESTALFWDVAVAAGETLVISAQSPSSTIQVGIGGTVGVRSSVASALTFTLYGVTADRGVR